MKNLICLIIVGLSTVLLVACAKTTPKPVEGMINPGDKIGDFLITTGAGKEVLYTFEWNTRCTTTDKTTYSCEHIVGKNLNVTAGLYDDSVNSSTPTAKLEELWKAFNYKLSIEDHPVNLEAFGYVDVKHPVLGVMRFWNVVVVTDKPGVISVRESGVAGKDPFEDITTFRFSEP